MKPDNYRAIKIISETISRLNLDLSRYTILTEVGSNNFIYTPIIPLLAGAKKVYAWTKDSSFGDGEDIVSECLEIIKHLGLEDRIEFSINRQNVEHIQSSDIITNSGFLRPLSKKFIQFAKPNIAIPIMFEAWELRDSDIDIAACTKQGIKVAGTWENHPLIQVFDYVKELTLKMIFEAGYEISGNKFIVWSNDEFGIKAKEVLELNNAGNVIVTDNYEYLKSNIKDTDVILIFDYHESRSYFGEEGLIDVLELREMNTSFGIIHLCGSVNYKYLSNTGISTYPPRDGYPTKMTFTLSHVGLVPVLRLLTAGFKVGQECLENNITELSQPINLKS